MTGSAGTNNVGRAEQALDIGYDRQMEGFDQAAKTIAEASGKSEEIIKNYLTQAVQEFKNGNTQGIDYLKGLVPQISSTIDQAINSYQSSTSAANQALATGQEQQVGALNTNYQKAVEQYTPYAQAGTNALTQYRDILSGKVSPTVDPIYQRGAQLLDQSLAAQGLTGSGTAVTAGMSPLVADLYSRQLTGLQNLINTGYGAATNTANTYTGLGSNLSNVYGTIAQGTSNNLMNQAQGLSSLYGQKAGYQSNIGQDVANKMTTGSQNLSNLLYQGGTNLSDLYGNTGTALASMQLGKAFANANKELVRASQRYATGDKTVLDTIGQVSNIMNTISSTAKNVDGALAGAGG